MLAVDAKSVGQLVRTTQFHNAFDAGFKRQFDATVGFNVSEDVVPVCQRFSSPEPPQQQIAVEPALPVDRVHRVDGGD